MSSGDESVRNVPRGLGPKAKRALVWAALCAAWLLFCAIQYEMTLSRMDDCEHGYMTNQEISLCVRHAIEAKYFVLAWGLGTPFLAALVLIFGAELKKILRNS